MSIFIAEIAGKDSIASVRKFMKENRGETIIPTIVYTGTEYGDRKSYYNSIEFLKSFAEEDGVDFADTIEISDGPLWNLICAKYQYLINKKYGFYTPCIGCHMFTHLVRVPVFKSHNADGIITGERFSHQGKLKANQHPSTIRCFLDMFNEKGINLVQPLVDIRDTDLVNEYIGNDEIIRHANDVKCVLSGNMHGFKLEEHVKDLEHYLDGFIKPVGTFCLECLTGGVSVSIEELDEEIKEILK